jgi:hypothetical protein
VGAGHRGLSGVLPPTPGESGTDRRDRRLPAEKPLLELTPGDLSRYKDRFVLADRALLFFDYLRSRMGKAAFFDLESTDYPERLRKAE